MTREREGRERERGGERGRRKHTLRSVWEFLAFALKATRNAYAIKCALERERKKEREKATTKKGEKKCE